MKTCIVPLLVVTILAPGCRGRCPKPNPPPRPTPSASFFNDGRDGDIPGGRPENSFPSPATRTMYFDVRDLPGARTADVALAPSSTTFEPVAEAPPAPEWARLPELRALAPNTDLQMRVGVLIARGPVSELEALRRRLDAVRGSTPPK
jgi:hypothetical protein